MTQANDIVLAKHQREAINKLRELCLLMREGSLWQIKEKAGELADAATEIRLRALKLGFPKLEVHP